MTKNLFVELSNAMADAAEKAGRSTVLVDARRKFPASGVAFAADLLLTADHVIERDEDIRVVLPDGTEVSASLTGRDPGTDLAVLKLEKPVATPGDLSTNAARVGQFVLAIGRPSSDGIQSSLGSVNAIGGAVRTRRGSILEGYIKTDVVSYPGFSGGPLVNGDGTILGINTSGFGNGGAITIPVQAALKTADALVKHGRIKRGYLGIRSQVVELTAEARHALKREQANGLLLVGLEADSPAGKGGLMVGDILAGIEGRPVSDQDDLYFLLDSDSVGRTLALDVLRGGKPASIKVEIGER